MNAERNQTPIVMEEVSVERDEMQKFTNVAGAETTDIELSFSSHGLRQLSLREVV